MTNTSDTWYEYLGIRAFVKDPCDVLDRKITIEGRIVDLFGIEASAQACIVPHGWVDFKGDPYGAGVCATENDASDGTSLANDATITDQ